MTVAQVKSYLESIDFSWELIKLPEDAYLVGGSVRDALLNRYKVPLDLDFVLPQKAIATARKIANLNGGGFVVLDQVREIARVVFPQGTLDLARQEGASLLADLNRRDFTINAIAYNIHLQQLVDPLGGLKDIKQGVLRMVSPQNLEDDPTIAAERVQAELNYIFTAPQGHKWLVAAIADGLLEFWLPSINSSKIEQLKTLTEGMEYCFRLGLDLPELAIFAHLATLVAAEPAIAEQELSKLKYARAQIKGVVKTVRYLPQLQQMSNPMSLREQYFWFLAVKDIFPVLIVRAIATGVSLEIIEPLIERYVEPTDQVAHPQSLVTGNDLINELNLKPSPVIGKLLTEIQIAQIESKITTPQQAIEFANSLLQTINLF